MNSKKAKLVIICAVLISVAGALWIAATSQRSLNTLTYSQFLKKVRNGQIAAVIIMGGDSGAVRAICRLKDSNAERTVLPSDYRDAMAAMQEKLVNIEIRDSSSGTLQLLYYSPIILILALWIFLVRKFQNGAGPSIPWLGSSRH